MTRLAGAVEHRGEQCDKNPGGLHVEMVAVLHQRCLHHQLYHGAEEGGEHGYRAVILITNRHIELIDNILRATTIKKLDWSRLGQAKKGLNLKEVESKRKLQNFDI